MPPSTLVIRIPLVVLASFSWGCDPGEIDEIGFRDGTQAQTAISDPEGGVWVNNGLEDPSIGGVDPQWPLSSPQGVAEGHGLLLDPERRSAVRYLVECALPEGSSIVKHVQGETLVFDGSIGLAPEWEDGTCDQDCQEWVSACLLARTNVSGNNVGIWMRADHPAIGMGGSLLFPNYEASFFGNLFTSGESEYLCQGPVVGPLLAQLDGRTCSNVLGESCGFTKYTTCEVEERCSFAGSPLAPVAVGCVGGSLAEDTSFHSISIYVATPPVL